MKEIIYTKEEVTKSTLEYFQGDVLASEIKVKKYLHQDLEGNYLDLNPDFMHKRMSKELARIESKYPNPLSEKVIYSYLKDYSQILAQGSPLSAIGNKYHIQSTSNCFVGSGVTEISDSYGGILQADQEIVQIAKRRGGIGQDISGIRPRGAVTRNAAKTSDGIGVFMERYSNSTNEVAQAGRRGALMLSLSVDHPDSAIFATIKNDKTKVTGANISLRLNNAFLKAVKEDQDYYLRFPVTTKIPENIEQENLPYNELVKKGKVYFKRIKAKELWNTIIHSAWLRAEPGLLFWDNIIDNSPTSVYKNFISTSTNPCAELPLSPYDSCRLFVVNLCYFVKNKFTTDSYFDFNEYLDVVHVAQRLMDDLIDLELEAIDKILEKISNDPEDWSIKKSEFELWQKVRQSCNDGRRTGLGITGLGDVLAMLGVTYGSKQAIDITENIYKHLAKGSYESSIKMASERGAFPAYEYALEKDHKWLNGIIDILDSEYQEMYKQTGRRNIACNTTAPTGTTSMTALLGVFNSVKYFGTTSGIEPLFLIGYDRRTKIMSDSQETPDFIDDLGVKWKSYTVYHTGVNLYNAIKETNAFAFINNPYVGSTSADINWVDSVKLQGQAQKWVDHSISKTVNLPSDATEELIAEVYMTAYESGCKGITVYRDGCRSGVLISNDPKDTPEVLPETHAPKRPKKVKAEIHFSHLDKAKWLMIVGLYGNKPYELFGGIIPDDLNISKNIKEGYLVKVKSGHYDLLDTEDNVLIKDITNTLPNTAYNFHTRFISATLRHGFSVQNLIDLLNHLSDKELGLFTFNKVAIRILKKFIPNGTKAKTNSGCPECGSTTLIYQEGCISCSCGFSKC